MRSTSRLRRIAAQLGGAEPAPSASAEQADEAEQSWAMPDWTALVEQPVVPMTDEQRFFFDLKGW